MSKILNFLSGKKSYVIAGTVFVLGGVQALGYPIPELVWTTLGAAGLGAVRAGIAKTEP